MEHNLVSTVGTYSLMQHIFENVKTISCYINLIIFFVLKSYFKPSVLTVIDCAKLYNLNGPINIEPDSLS